MNIHTPLNLNLTVSDSILCSPCSVLVHEYCSSYMYYMQLLCYIVTSKLAIQWLKTKFSVFCMVSTFFKILWVAIYFQNSVQNLILAKQYACRPVIATRLAREKLDLQQKFPTCRSPETNGLGAIIAVIPKIIVMPQNIIIFLLCLGKHSHNSGVPLVGRHPCTHNISEGQSSSQPPTLIHC